jgi:hypothetical protein
VVLVYSNGVVAALSRSNITFSLLSISRPNVSNFYTDPNLLDFVLASKVRLGFQGYNFNSSDARHYYYGLYEVLISGRSAVYLYAVKEVLFTRCSCASKYLLASLQSTFS